MYTTANQIIQFELPPHLACPPPTEARHIERDQVRLLVTTGEGDTHHDTFTHFDQYLQAGDVLVVNTSAMRAAALPVTLPNGNAGMLHLSNSLTGKTWLAEIRALKGSKTYRWQAGETGMLFSLPGGATFMLRERFYQDHESLDLWVGEFCIDFSESAYLEMYGKPIKYTQLDKPFPMAYYQTYFSFHPGSAEMPSASRGFTTEVMKKLVEKGVIIAPILLHCGVSSLEDHEKPYPEYMEINPISALQINQAKAEGRRVIAVGTTAIRAVETAVNAVGEVIPYRGHTDLYIHEGFKMQVVDSLLTGFHEPRASHLHMLQSLAGFQHINRAYREALAADYYWHQFGDLHLILG